MAAAYDGAAKAAAKAPRRDVATPSDVLPLVLPRILLWGPVDAARQAAEAKDGGRGSAAARRQRAAELATAIGDRIGRAQRGDLAALLAEMQAAAADARARLKAAVSVPSGAADETIEQARAAEVVALIRRGELSRATQRLASPGIAQGSAEVEQRLREMLGVNAPTPMPPASPDGSGLDNVTGLDFDTFLLALRQAPRGGGADVFGIAYEHLQTVLEDRGMAAALFRYCDAMARCLLPAPVVDAIATARFTPALKGAKGKLRPLVCGSTLRCLSRAAMPDQQVSALPGRLLSPCVRHEAANVLEADLDLGRVPGQETRPRRRRIRAARPPQRRPGRS